MIKNKIYIIAGNYRQYLDYITLNKLNKWEYIYVYDKIVLFGAGYSTVILIGTYQSRVDWNELNDIIDINESKIIIV